MNLDKIKKTQVSGMRLPGDPELFTKEDRDALIAEVERLQKENEKLRKWKVKACNELPMYTRIQIHKEVENEQR